MMPNDGLMVDLEQRSNDRSSQLFRRWVRAAYHTGMIHDAQSLQIACRPFLWAALP